MRKGYRYKLRCSLVGEFVGTYMGREEGYSCMICGKGSNAYGFNVYNDTGYETYFYGKEHMPEVLEELE